jgi:peptide/nickel transport system permease protein
MLNYVLRRMLYAVPVLFGVMLITFLLFNVLQTPDAAAAINLGPKATKVARDQWIAARGLDQPLPVQFGRHLVKLATFQFEPSWRTGRDMREVFLQGAGPSLLITVPGFFCGLLAALGLSLYQVFVRHSALDHGITLLSVALMSVPAMVFIIFGQAVVALSLNYFPAFGFDWRGFETLKFVILPVMVMVVINLGYDTRLYRAIFLEEIGHDYVRTAFAKGLSNSRVLGVHVFKNGLIALITLTVSRLPALIMGSLLIENFFGIPGLGNVLFMAIQTSDQPVVLASVYLGSLLYIASLILTDIAYALADPRIRLS